MEPGSPVFQSKIKNVRLQFKTIILTQQELMEAEFTESREKGVGRFKIYFEDSAIHKTC